jgi:hypothetical protein
MTGGPQTGGIEKKWMDSILRVLEKNSASHFNKIFSSFY